MIHIFHISCQAPNDNKLRFSALFYRTSNGFADF